MGAGVATGSRVRLHDEWVPAVVARAEWHWRSACCSMLLLHSKSMSRGDYDGESDSEEVPNMTDIDFQFTYGFVLPSQKASCCVLAFRRHATTTDI